MRTGLGYILQISMTGCCITLFPMSCEQISTHLTEVQLSYLRNSSDSEMLYRWSALSGKLETTGSSPGWKVSFEDNLASLTLASAPLVWECLATAFTISICVGNKWMVSLRDFLKLLELFTCLIKVLPCRIQRKLVYNTCVFLPHLPTHTLALF